MYKIQSAILGATLLLASFITSARTIEMEVNGLVCSFCAQGIEKHLRKEAATEDVFVSLKHSLVAVALKSDSDIPDERLRALLQDAGYTVVSITRSDAKLDDVRTRVKQ